MKPISVSEFPEFPVPAKEFPVPRKKFPVPRKKFPVPQRTGNFPATH
jgi:hypothetical protein